MRTHPLRRLAFIFLAIYLVFLGGAAYYDLVLPIRLFHHALLTILLAWWLIVRILRGRGLPQTPLNPAIYAAVIVWIVSAAQSLDPRMAFEHLWLQFVHVLFFFVLIDLFHTGRERLVMETQFILGALVLFLSGVELASWYFGLGIIPGTNIGWIDVIGPGAWIPLRAPRLSLAMNVSTLLAGYVAPLVVILAVWAQTTPRRDFRIVLGVMAALILGVLVLTSSRGGLLSLFTAVGFLAVMRLARQPRVTQVISARTLYTGALLAGISAAVLFILLTLNEARSFGDAGRLDMWSNAVRISGDYVLLGVGPGQFGRAFRIYRDPSLAQDKLVSAHNAYLNTAAETGLSGVVVSLWLAQAFVRTWYRNWHNAFEISARLRLEAAFGALLGIGVHSLVDVFTITPIVLLILTLAAYCTTRERVVSFTRPCIAAVALVTVLAYGLWFTQIDQAQVRYQRSLRGGETALAEAQAASLLDPSLNLYPLQIANILGQRVSEGSENALNEAIQAYEHAVALEPTWDTGWINLAAMAEQYLGDPLTALDYLDTAWGISSFNSASLHWARLADQTNSAPSEDIVDAYVEAMKYSRLLPLSTFWGETELRREALERYAGTLEQDAQYRIYAVFYPDRATTLVPVESTTAAEWWITGEYALTVDQDSETAMDAFDQAIQRAPAVGDYYVSLARVTLTVDPVRAARDLNIAELLGTAYEYPNAVRARLVKTDAEREALLAGALPQRLVLQEFAAALYGRSVATFDVLPAVRQLGPGRIAMEPWYELAAKRLASGDVEGAVRVYRAIVDYAPDEVEARELLATVG
jgi:tetratricopeptide (TPR) repeat protein